MKIYKRTFSSVYFIPAIIIFYIVFFPQMAYADNLAGYVVVIFMILIFTLLFSSVISFFMKYGLFKLIPGRTFNTSYPSILTATIGELVIMYIGFWILMITTSSVIFDKLRIINYLSALSPDIAFLALQKIIIEHKYYLPLTVKLIFFVIIMFFVNSTLNLKFLQRNGDKFITTTKNKSTFFYAGLLGIIAPAIFCVSINYFLIKEYKSDVLAGRFTIVKEYDKQVNIMLLDVVQAGYPRLVELMINRGADIHNIGRPNTKDLYQKTALHLAVKNTNNLATVKLLLEKGADINRRERYGYTALINACSVTKANPEMIQLLIDSGADVNAQTRNGQTALMIVSSRNIGVGPKRGVKETDIARKLLDNGADVNIRKSNGQTALMAAAGASNIELLKLLLAHGADINARNKEDKSAYMLSSNGLVKKILLEHGANQP